MRALAADAAATTHAAAATRVPAALRQPLLLLGRDVRGGAAPGDVSRDLPGFAQPRMPPLPHLRPHVAPLLLEEGEGGSPPP